MLTIGVDAHKQVHAAVAVDALGREQAHWRGPNTPTGWQELAAWGHALDAERQWGIEGAWHYGRGLAQTLVAAGDRVVEVNPRLTAGERRGGRERGKSDRLDARSVARVVNRDAVELPVVPAEDGTSVLALWSQERDQLQREATRLGNEAHQVLALLDPTYQTTLGDLTTATAIAALVTCTVSDRDAVLAQARAAAVRRLGARLQLVHEQLAQVTASLEAVGRQSLQPLDDLYGIGPLTASYLAGQLGPGKRFPTDACLANHSGAAPLEASSGEVVRHRLNRGGNRQLNAILERIALTQGRGDPGARTYLARRRSEGRTDREARRALKRFICRAIWRAWQDCPIPTLNDLAPFVIPADDSG
ncbi:MAG TPA: IS110 family transposase [Thermomicrobiales bacterium]|nr:IS110 family transposase [Thermomicrobiales bacterium]